MLEGRIAKHGVIWVRIEDDYGPDQAHQIFDLANAHVMQRIVNHGDARDEAIWLVAWRAGAIDIGQKTSIDEATATIEGRPTG